MDYSNWITGLLSGLIVAGASKVFDWYSSSVTYQRDYYKKIIDHRLGAYQKLNDAITPVKNNIERDGLKYPTVFDTRNEYYKFINTLFDVSAYFFWYTPETSVALKDYIETIERCRASSGLTINDDDMPYRKLGSKNYQLFFDKLLVLDKSIFIDYKDMGNVKGFFDTRINNKV